jgi:hypothetical protein
MKQNESNMTTEEFTYQCSLHVKGIIGFTAKMCNESGEHKKFVQEMIEQDSDEGSRSGTERVLGPKLYAALQTFK